MRTYYVYILTNRPGGVLYTGVTNDLERRLWEHRARSAPGFTRKYNADRLVYLEATDSPIAAIEREKQIKRWVRRKKIGLIEIDNPEWKDLSRDWG